MQHLVSLLHSLRGSATYFSQKAVIFWIDKPNNIKILVKILPLHRSKRHRLSFWH